MNNKIDSQPGKSHNTNVLVISNGEDATYINKRDLNWVRAGGHEHHYLPDFTDETDVYIALKCAVGNCIHGVLRQKGDKAFTDWLEGHRVKA